jgi:hypothetical protein
VRDSRGSNDTYNRYIFPDGVVDIPTNVIIPKIWDFAYVRYNNVEMYKKYYNYIDDLPTYQGIKEEFRDNDVFIFLQDMDGFLRKNNIADNIFNNLDLQRIRDAVSNTDAINEYFRQNPILSNYEPRHRIIHTFETN